MKTILNTSPGTPTSRRASDRDACMLARWDELIHRVARGEHRALAHLYEQSSRLVYSLALRILGKPEDAEEATLDVYIQVWRQASRFDRRRGNARSWLTVLTRGRAIDHLRSTLRHPRDNPIDTIVSWLASNDNPEEEAATNQRRRRVREALMLLPSEQHDAIELAFFSGLSHTEVAKSLGRPLGTVKSRIRVGLTKLRELLEAGAGSETLTTSVANPRKQVA